ncbi:MAG: glycosyltransferase family 39 protein [Candidatus Saccharimonadales bacterium]
MKLFNRLFGRKKLALLDKFDYLFLAPGLAVYLAVTLWTITKSSIWFDEAFGAYLIRFDFFDIAKYTAADVHPPMSYWLLKLWSMMFGTGELALRSMSVFFGITAIILGYLLVKRLFGQKAAAMSLIFMALSPMLVRYGQEARMYTLVATIALAATYALIFAMNSKRRLPWVIYGILVSLGMWTHYFVAIVWLAHWIWRADVIRRTAKKGKFIKSFFSKNWILSHLLAIGLFLPWLPYMLTQLTIVQAFGFWIPPVTPNTPINFLTNLIYYQDVGQVTGWMAAAFVVMAVILGILAYKIYKSLDDLRKQSYCLIMAVAFVPMILLIALSMPPLRSSFIDRYLMTSVVGVALFIGVTFALGSKYLGSRWRVIIPSILVIMMTVGVSNVWQLGNYNKNEQSSKQTRQIVEEASANSSVGQPIIAESPWLFYEAVFYSTNDHPVYYIDPIEYNFGSLEMLKNNDHGKIKEITAFTAEHPTFWYIAFSKSGNVTKPYDNWQVIQEITLDDPINGGPEYKAIEYKIAD